MNEPEPPDIGQQVRTLREQRGLSLRALGTMCGLSASAISQIERGSVSPSVATLHRLAHALDVPMVSFFQEPESPVKAILSRPGERRHGGRAGVLLESLGSGLKDQSIESFVVTLQPGAGGSAGAMSHLGHELAYCLHGCVEYDVAGTVYRLEPGHALLFEASLTHHWHNCGDSPAAFLLVFESEGEDLARRHLAS
jgi:transcriptional regulator with XRE-family HTH domain